MAAEQVIGLCEESLEVCARAEECGVAGFAGLALESGRGVEHGV